MSESILFNFAVGLIIGGMCGVMIMALINVRKYDNMSKDIQDLRTQRRLLKEELLKKQPSKPKPRKYRKKNVRSK